VSKNLRADYRTIADDPFPAELTLTLGTQRLHFRKRTWRIRAAGGTVEERGLRYGENPGQPAALYEPVASELAIPGVTLLAPGAGLVGSITEENLIQFGKHPGKTNLTDVDSAILVLRYLTEGPACAIMKHNNPCAVARGEDAAAAVTRAYRADPLAAFGGCVVLNRPLSREAASFLSTVFIEVLACPDYEEGALAALEKKRSLRIIRLPRLGELGALEGVRSLHVTSLTDGSLIVQLSPVNTVTRPEDFLPAEAEQDGAVVRPRREPTDCEYADMLFGWAVEHGVISNSVLFARDGATVAIGAGGQDRVGVVKQAIAKAYDRLRDRLALDRHGVLFFELDLAVRRGEHPQSAAEEIEEAARARRGDLPGSVLVSDAFFPRRDGIDLALEAGATAVCHPGGSLRDAEGIEAVNETHPPAAMVFTGRRIFRH
jgi:phosphoribosylaminoimidazolecarboxamide formyltransferase/IMP cyclohydrolase